MKKIIFRCVYFLYRKIKEYLVKNEKMYVELYEDFLRKETNMYADLESLDSDFWSEYEWYMYQI